MSSVFVSHSAADSDVADRIAADLTQAGSKVFSPSEIRPGEAWAPRLRQEIERASYFLALISPSYLASPQARKELETAVLADAEGRTRFIPVLIQDTKLPPFIRDKQYADLRQDYESGMAKVKEELTRKPAVSEEAQERRSAKRELLFSIMVSLTAAGMATAAYIGASTFTLVPVIGVAVGLTTLVGAIGLWRPYYRRSLPVEVIAQTVERAYVDALEESNLNPLRVQEGKHG